MNIMGKALQKAHTTIFRAIDRHDLSRWEHEPDLAVPVYGVYHVYCDKGWQDMVSDQISRLKASGLYDATTRLYVSCIAADESAPAELLGICGKEKAELISVERDPKKFEYPAIEFLHRKCGGEDCLVYYFHTKGISYQAVRSSDRKFEGFKRNIEAWRHMMEYFIFDKWKVAVNTLSDGYDTYGCYRLPPYPKPYYLYAGNFWWARSGYVRKLPQFDNGLIADNRFIAEEWLYKGRPKDFSAFDTLADLYSVYMDKSLYAAPKLPLLKWIKFVARFNFVKICKHVFGYDYKKRCQKSYQSSGFGMARK